MKYEVAYFLNDLGRANMAKLKCFGIVCLILAVGIPAYAVDETEYSAVFMQGKKVGHAVHTRKVEDGKVTTTEDVSITISRVGVPVTVQMTETSIETTEGKPLAFESIQLLGFVTMKVTGTVNDQGIIEMTNSSMGSVQKSTAPWPEGALMSEGLRLLTLEKGLEPGVEYTVKVFNPGITDALEANVLIGEKKNVDLLGRVVKLTEMTTTVAMPG